MAELIVPAAGEESRGDVVDTTTTSSVKRSRIADGGHVEGELERAGEKGTDEKADAGHPNSLWKTTLCSYFRRQSGSCNHGDACRYAHGEDELRPRPDNTWDPTSQRAKKLFKADDGECQEQHYDDKPREPSDEAPDDGHVEDVLGCLDGAAPEKCIVGLPRSWDSDKLRGFLNQHACSCSHDDDDGIS